MRPLGRGQQADRVAAAALCDVRDGLALRKAQVTLIPGNVPPAITDANGRFIFRKLPPATYTLHAQHPEFPLIVSGLAATSPLMVMLGPQEKKSDLVMALIPGASISGSVMDEDGRPLSGCNVQTLQFAPGPGRARWPSSGSGGRDRHSGSRARP